VAQRRRACLDDELAQMAGHMARALRQPQRVTSMWLIEEAPQPARCALIASTRTSEPGPARTFVVRAFREGLYGVDPANVARIEQLWDDAKRLDDVALAVFAARTLAAVVDGAHHDLASRMLREAMDLAAARGDEVGRVETAIELVRFSASGHASEARRWIDDARARVAKLGGDRQLEGDLDYALARAYNADRALDDEIAAYQRAASAYAAAYGPRSVHAAVVEQLLGFAYRTRDPSDQQAGAALDRAFAIYRELGVEPPGIGGQPDLRAQIAHIRRVLDDQTRGGAVTADLAETEGALAALYLLVDEPASALQHFRRVLAISEQLGLRGPSLAIALTQVARLELDAGHVDEALAVAARARELDEALALADWTASVLSVQGRAYLARGDDARARPLLQRALELGERIHDPPRLRGRTMFLLARATWPVDRQRAVALAHGAQITLEAGLAELDLHSPVDVVRARKVSEQLAEARAWLASHH
jgi:tetratricopeptide (TPR) repeat protein